MGADTQPKLAVKGNMLSLAHRRPGLYTCLLILVKHDVQVAIAHETGGPCTQVG